MSNIDLRKLNRKQLLELLLEQTQRADQLEEQLELANQKLENRSMIEQEAGSIANAALQINGVFDAAQLAANQYLENVKQQCKTHEEKNALLEQECKRRCQLMIQKTNAICKQKELECNKKIEKLTKRVETLIKLKNQLEEILKEEIKNV